MNMAKENVKAFFEALSKDEALQQALKEKEVAYTGMKEDRAAIVKEVLLPVAEEAGYAFTLEELKEFESSMQAEGELAEDELEAIAAGGVKTWGACMVVGVAGGTSCIVLGVGICLIAGAGAVDH